MYDLKYDIIVVGGGFAGSAAAIAAARQNKKVLLLEQSGSLGGAAVNSLVIPFMGYSTAMPDESGKMKKFPLVQGIFKEMVTNLRSAKQMRTGHFNTDYLKVVLDKMTFESGVDVLFHATVTKVNKLDRKITSVDFYTVGGMMNAKADVFIDATGDGNLAMLSGCEFNLGREEDSLCQPMTLCFRISGTNIDEVRKIEPQIQKLYKQFKKQNKILNPREDVLIFGTHDKNIVHFNTTRIVKLNPTDPFELSQAERLAREQMVEIFEFLKKNFEVFKDAKISSSGMSIGVRESRMVLGEHYLTGDELVKMVRFPDAIAAGNYDIDIHNPEGSGTSHYYFKPGEYYTIPFGSLVAKDADNLLVAGRCISCDHRAQASVRIMPICAAMGEAAGVGAAVIAEDNSIAKNADIKEIQSILKSKGAFIGI